MTDRDPEVIGIIGAGVKGRKVAVRALLAGYQVILEDISSVRLTAAKKQIFATLRATTARGHSTAENSSVTSDKFCVSPSMDHVFRSADLLIEAAPEDAELQLEMFTIFDKFAKPNAIFASTARSVSIADLAEMTNCPERCVGLRFAEDEGHLQIVAAPKTSQRTLQICSNFARRSGFESEIVPEAGDPAAIAKVSMRP